MTNYRNDRTEVLESDANPNVKRWRRLATDPRFVKKAGATLLEGAHLAECYFQTGLPVTNLLVAQSANAEARHWVETYERERGLRPRVVADRLWQTLSPVEHGVGIMLEVPVPKTKDVDFSREDVLYLDGVQDAGNVGTLIRTAVAAGFRTIAASPKTAGFYAPKVMRAGMGAHSSSKTARSTSLPSATKERFSPRTPAAAKTSSRRTTMRRGPSAGFSARKARACRRKPSPKRSAAFIFRSKKPAKASTSGRPRPCVSLTCAADALPAVDRAQRPKHCHSKGENHAGISIRERHAPLFRP